MYIDILKAIENDKSPVVIYGAGPIAEVVYYILTNKKMNVNYICDKNLKKQGNKFGEVVISSPDIILSLNEPIILVTVMQGTIDVVTEYKDKGFNKVYTVSSLIKDFNFQIEESSSKIMYYRYCCKIYLSYAGKKIENQLSIRYLALSVTERCSLKCKDCANLMQYFKNPIHYDFDRIANSINNLSKSVDKIITLALIGGEPFLYNRLDEVINSAGDINNIETILILTNGTIIPSPKVLNAIKENNVVVFISNYGEVSNKANELMKTLEENGIGYMFSDIFYWNDMGNLKCRNYSEESLIALYDKCNQKYEWSLVDGIFSCCGRASSGMILNAFQQEDDEYVNLLDYNLDLKEMREKIKKMITERKYFTACNHCNGQIIDNSKIDPAIQTKEVLEILF